jgi:hypothetical protein
LSDFNTIWTSSTYFNSSFHYRNRKEAKGITKENMEGRVTRGDKKEKSNMEKGGKDSKG